MFPLRAMCFMADTILGDSSSFIEPSFKCTVWANGLRYPPYAGKLLSDFTTSGRLKTPAFKESGSRGVSPLANCADNNDIIKNHYFNFTIPITVIRANDRNIAEFIFYGFQDFYKLRYFWLTDNIFIFLSYFHEQPFLAKSGLTRD